MTQLNVDFPQPPRLTGMQDSDFPALVEYVWSLYRTMFLQNGVVKTDDFETQMQEKFLRIYNLGKLVGPDADQLPYFTAPDEWTVTSLSAFGRQLIAVADAAAALALIGASTGVTDEQIDDRVASLIQNGTGITWSYDDTLGKLTPTVTVSTPSDAAIAAIIAAHHVDNVVPTGTINGVNDEFDLPSAPNPASSLLLKKNASVLDQGVGYTLITATRIKYAANYIPQPASATSPEDTHHAWYRI